MKTQTGVKHQVPNREYIIPHESYYFHVTSTDGVLRENCKGLYEKLLKTVKLKVVTAKKYQGRPSLPLQPRVPHRKGQLSLMANYHRIRRQLQHLQDFAIFRK